MHMKVYTHDTYTNFFLGCLSKDLLKILFEICTIPLPHKNYFSVNYV